MFRPLRQALEKWFDTFSDGWNPIMVRELRRGMRTWILPVITLLHLGLLTVIHVADLKDPHAEFLDIVLRIFPTIAAMLLVILLTVGNDVRTRMADELLDAVPLTPKERVHGVLGTSCFLSAFFLVQALPFLLFSTSMPYSVLIRLGILLSGFVITQIVVLHFLSFFIRAKTTIEVVIVCLAIIYPFQLNTIALEGPFVVMGVLWFFILQLPELPDPVLTSWPFIAVASVGGVLALASFAWLNYRLSLYHFGKRSKSCWSALGVNLFWLLVWSSYWAGITFVIASCFV